MLSFCGLVCTTCPIYIVTREKNKKEQTKKRTEIAEICNEHYGTHYGVSDITDCDGCRMEGGRLFSGCIDCTIRECAKSKAIENCAACSDYGCQKLELFFSKDPSAKSRLDDLRKRIS